MSVSFYRHSHPAVKAILTIDLIYRTIPKYSDTPKIAVIILKFEQYGSAIE